MAESYPKEYSEHTWALLDDALSIITALEIRINHEENTHPLDR